MTFFFRADVLFLLIWWIINLILFLSDYAHGMADVVGDFNESDFNESDFNEIKRKLPCEPQSQTCKILQVTCKVFKLVVQ